MHKLSLVIPAKKEKESLPLVLEELKNYKLNKLVVLEPGDYETIDSIKNFDCEIIYQKKKGYGDAINLGIENVKSELFCIFNADGSFNPSELKNMENILESQKADIIFASRYEKDCGSDDDTIITYLGNYIFTKIGKIFFSLNVTDILYTYVMAKTDKIKKLNLEKNDFRLCVELPIKAKRANLNINNSKSYERERISGKKKVNAIRDGLYILSEMLRLFFFRS
tara:strand:- start:527 stop:1198 length:672 start_codon:yes stop_codon:yes gene_type:complete